MDVAPLSRTVDRGAGRVRAIGLLGAAVQLALAGILALVAGRPDEFPNPPQLIPRGVALAGIFAVPAIVGAIGAWHGRRSLLAAAAAVSTIGSVLAFSGVTLVFLVPALIFGTAAGAGPAPTFPRARPSWHAVAILALAVVGVVAASLQLGIFVVPMIVLAVIVLQVSRGATRTGGGGAPSMVGLVAALSIVALVVGSGVALLGLTGTQCWRAYRTPTGIEYRDAPDTGEAGTISLAPDEIAGGCDSGVPTPGGLAAASVLGLAAIGIAVVTARRRA